MFQEVMNWIAGLDYFSAFMYVAAMALYIASFLGAVLANNGICPRTGRMLIEPFHVRVIRSLMCTCGMYDDSGEFALRVGFPAKSGVGGGIMGVVPGRMGIGTYCPALDQKGNSLCGLRAMEYLSQALDLSLF